VGRDVPGRAEPARPAPVEVAAVASYDPEGDGAEHEETVAAATDRDATTYWTTETYRSFAETKSGVGLVLEVGGEAKELIVGTDLPGFTAEIRAGESAGGPFDRVVSDARTVSATTAFPLKGDSAPFYVIWITGLDGRAHVTEVRAS
jgi:hypothetical protein